MAEPATSFVSAGIAGKLAIAAGIGALAAWIMARFDKPQSRGEFFTQILAAVVSSAVFGDVVRDVLVHFAGNYGLTAENANAPALALTGALGYGAFGALAEFRKILQARGAKFLAGKAGIDTESK